MSAVAAPTSTAPVNAISAPITNHRGNPSPSSNPANSAMRIGPTLTSIAAVPASMRCSAAFSATLYTPNHARPQSVISAHSRAVGGTQRRRPTTSPAPSASAATRSRPSASGPAS